MFKRICSLLLAMIMVIGLLPMAVFADEVDNTTVITEPAPTETEPVPTETEPVPTETEPVPTETEPVPTETEPVPTETEPVPTETEPVPTETEPVPTEDPLAEAKATLEAMIAALPTPEEVAAMSDAEKEAFYNEKLLPIYTFAMENGLSLDENVTWNQVNVALAGGLDTGDEVEWDGENIATVDDLKAFAAAVNAGDSFDGKTVTLTADIEVNDYWFNNETSVDYRINKDFAGTFDGKGYAIKGLKFQNKDIAKNPSMYLFSSISGTVKNLTLDDVDADINDRDCFGFIAYKLTGTAENCHVKNVTVDVAVNDNDTGYMYSSGAMFGQIVSATVTGCTASRIKYIPTGTDNSDNVGALIGIASGTENAHSTIKNCSVTDFTLDGTRKTKRTGGFIGNTGYTDVSDCTATNITFDVENYAQTVGGFVGAAGTGSTFTRCKVDSFKLFNASDAKYPADAGGFCAYAGNASFTNCSVTGLDIDLACNDAKNSWAFGGFLGYASGAVTAENCNVAGDIDVTGTATGNQITGSFIGSNENQNVTTNGCTTSIDAELPFNGAAIGIAKIGENNFTTLAAAITTAKTGDTIILLSDVEITEETTFTMAEGTVLDLSDHTIKGDDGKAIFTGTNFTIKNGTITGFNGKDYYPITIGGGSATLEGLTFVSGGVKIRNSAVVTLRDNAITANQSDFKYAVWAYGSANVTIESGTYFGGKNGYDVFAEGGAKLTLYGGTYKVTNNKTYMAKNAELVYFKNADGTYTVKVDGIYTYADLVAAIAEANNGDVLELKANIAAEGQVVINKSLTLNLGEFTITGSIAGDGVVRIVADEVINVTISATTGGITNTAEGYAINSGNITDDNAKTNLIINGGNYAATQCIYQNNGLCTINGGSFKAADTQLTLNNKDGYLGDFMVNGGKFYLFNPACMSINKGEHHNHDNIAEGKTTTRDADGWYTVVEGTSNFVAQVSSKYESLDRCYTNLADAIADAKAATIAAEGAVIKLIADCTIDLGGATVTLPDYATLDLNGHTLTVPFQKTLFAGNNITICNGTLTTGSTENYGLYIMSGSFTLENVTTTNGINVQAGNVTLKDVNATCPNKYYAVYAGADADVTILSGNYKTVRNEKNLYADGKITVYGGTFSKDPSDYVAEGYYVCKNGNNFVVCKLVMTYEELVAAVESNSVVKLGADITAPKTVVINKSLTLDLGEFTITGNTDEAVLRAYSAVADTVIDVTINATTGGIKNSGTGYAIYAGEDLDGGNDAERTNLTVNGGNYESAGTDCIRQIVGLCTINGGSYKSSYGRTVLNGKQWYGAEFKINGGTFYEFNPACVSVWTGFNGKDYTNFYHQHDIIADGKTAEYKDGWYTVVDGTYTAVAETKSMCYPSVEAALKASINLNDVANLGTITLLANDTLDLNKETITLPKGLVIDLNGKTLTVPFQKTLFAGENITIKNGTITTGGKESYGLYIMSGSFTLEDVTCTNGISVQAAEVILKDCDVTNPNSRYYAVYAGDNADVTILSGTYQNPYNTRNHPVLYGSITVYGGSFSKTSPNAFVAEGEDLHVVKSGSWYTVYEGFQNALNAAKAGDTAYLLSNIEVAETIKIDKNLTLDLGESTITSTAKVGVYANGGNLTINGTTGGIVVAGTVAVGQDNGVCTINGGSFRADGDTSDVANGNPVKYRYTLDNSNTTQDGITGSFVINGGKFYGFNPACMFINPDDGHDHDSISAGKVAVLDENGWFTVAEGTLTHTIVCECDYPAPSHQYCFTSEDQATLFISLFTSCEHDKIVKIAE